VALVVQTLRPSSTPQINGTYATVTGAASANAALSDNSDSSYVQLNLRCRLDSQVLRVGFPTPTLPAGARVLSVGLRRRVQTVIAIAGTPPPTHLHWFRCSSGAVTVSGQVPEIAKTPFSSPCPTSTTTTAWVTESLGTFTTAPDGAVWDPATTLNGVCYDMGRGDDTGVATNVSEVYLDVTYQQLSSVTVTGPTATVSTTRPTVTWAYASPDSQPQQAWRVMIYTAAQVAALGFTPFTTAPLQDSGQQIGEDQQWTLTADLVDGQYSAYVQAVSAWSGAGGDFDTAIASTSWTRTSAPASPPPNATLSSVTFDATNNRVPITMVPSGSSPVTAAFTVFASRDNGVTFTPIPSLTLIPANGMTPIVAYDYTAPINVTSQYKVMAYSQPSGVYVAAAGFSSTLLVTTTGSDWWLKDPANPLNNTLLPVAAPSKAGGTGSGGGLKVVRRRMQGTFEPLGGAGNTVHPIVVSGPYYGERGELELLFKIDDPVDYFPAFDALDRSGHVLLLQKPNGDQVFCVLGPGSGGQDTELRWDGQAGVSSQILYRRVTTSYTETNPPSYY